MIRLSDLLHRRPSHDDLSEEIRAHLDEKVEALVKTGMSRRDAALEARRAFGNVTGIEESAREVWGTRVFDSAGKDIAFAVRLLRRSPTFAAVAVLSLAIGIGANAAVFSVVDALLLRRLPVRDPGALVSFSRRDAQSGERAPLTFKEFNELRARTTSFTGILAASTGGGSLSEAGAPPGTPAEHIRAGRVSSNFFEVLGITMALGRGFVATDDATADPERSVVLSYAYWQRRFGGDSSILGKSVVAFRDIQFTVVGVAAPGFRGIEADQASDIWWPLAVVRLVGADRFHVADWPVTVMGRLRPGVSIATARTDARLRHSAIAAEELTMHQDWNEAKRRQFLSRHLDVESGATGVAEATRTRFSQSLFVLMLSVIAVLLIASTNVGALLLARSTARRRELALRLALGGGRGRLLRQLITENAMLVGIATAVGLAATPAIARLLLSYAPPEVAPSLGARFDLHLIGFVVLIAVGCTMIIGVLPAIRSTSALRGALGAGARTLGEGPSSVRIHRLIIASQMALSMSLLVVAGLFMRTLHNLRTVDTGFDRKQLIVVNVAGGAVTAPVARAIAPALGAIPGVISATYYANTGLLGGGAAASDCIVDGQPPASSDDIKCVLMQVGPRFFETTSTRMVAGRPFGPGDDQAGAHVAIISETMARRYFGGESAIGHRVNGLDVVGVARDTKYTSLRDPAQPMLYTPVIGGWIVADVRFVIHSQRDPAQLTADIRRAVKETGAGRELTGIQSINEIAESTLARERLLAELATSFGALALVLACIGLYGTMSYAVTRRTNEIGIRMALGATREGVVSQLMRESAATVAPGLVIGAVGAFAVSRMLSRLLFGLGAGDPITIGVAVVVLAASAAVAAYLPARRASGADPLAALRAD